MHHVFDPVQEPAGAGVHPWEGGVAAALPPGGDPDEVPAPVVALAEQRARAVTVAAAQAPPSRRVARTQHVAGEMLAVPFLARH